MAEDHRRSSERPCISRRGAGGKTHAPVTGVYIQNLTNIPLRWTCGDTPDPDKTLLVPSLEPYEAPLGNDLYVRVAAGGAGQVAILTITGE